MNNLELTPWQRNFLQTARVGRLATLDNDGFPSIVPFCFVLHDDSIYSIIDEKPKRQDFRKLARIRNIERNSKVGVVVDEYSEDWRALRFIQFKGDADLVWGGGEYDAVLRLLKEKYPQYRKMNFSGRPLIRISVSRVFSWSWQENAVKIER